MERWGRSLQRRQSLALLLVLVAFTVAMVGGVTGAWPVILAGGLALLGVLGPMAAVRSRR